MRGNDTDDDWRRLGELDPYWAVDTHDRFRRENLDDARRAEFFDRGRHHLDAVLDLARKHLDPSFRPTRALDFGCGVGRVIVPLARLADHVTGVDVSEPMLREAAANCEREGLSNVDLVRGDDTLAAVRGSFDLVHSFIVFQHIPPARGEALLARLLEVLAPGGVGALHFTYAKDTSPARHRGRRIIGALGLGGPLRALREAFVRREGARLMQMNEHDLGTIGASLQRAGARSLHVELSDHAHFFGAMILFRREPARAPYLF